jgi:hypothetical protein
MPCCRSRLRTVCELILRNPGIPAAVVDAATVRFRRWKTQMYRSSPGIVTRGLPLLWWSFVDPVCWNLFYSVEMVLWLTFRVRATSFWDSPALVQQIKGLDIPKLAKNLVQRRVSFSAAETWWQNTCIYGIFHIIPFISPRSWYMNEGW